jgi:hypothetical membrane protein
MGVYQWEHLYESLYDCVSCPVYIVWSLRLFHYGCVSVIASVWKLAWLCVLSCIYCLESCLKLFHYGCVSVRAYVWKFAWLCILSCIYCLESLVISFWVCVSESKCMKVCMIVCWHTIIQTFIQMLSLTHTHNEITSLHDCVACTVYIFLDLRLFHYGCVSVRASVWKLA